MVFSLQPCTKSVLLHRLSEQVLLSLCVILFWKFVSDVQEAAAVWVPHIITYIRNNYFDFTSPVNFGTNGFIYLLRNDDDKLMLLLEPLSWQVRENHMKHVQFSNYFVCLFGWLLNVPATGWCISGTDLLRQFYALPHRDRSCRSNVLPHPVTVY